MSDNKAKQGKAERPKGTAHAVRDLADKHDLTKDQAKALLERHPNDRDLLEAAADKILKPEDINPKTA